MHTTYLNSLRQNFPLVWHFILSLPRPDADHQSMTCLGEGSDITQVGSLPRLDKGLASLLILTLAKTP